MYDIPVSGYIKRNVNAFVEVTLVYNSTISDNDEDQIIAFIKSVQGDNVRHDPENFDEIEWLTKRFAVIRDGKEIGFSDPVTDALEYSEKSSVHSR